MSVRRRWISIAVGALMAGGLPVAVGIPSATAATPPTYSWPQFHHDAQLTGVSADPSLSTSNAASLGVSWMTYTGAQVLASPVVAWNAEDAKTLVYSSNEAGYLTAYNQATGLPVWSLGFQGGMRSTPLVDGASLWVAPTTTHRFYKLDAGTGAVECSAPLPYNTDSSPVMATPPGGKPTLYIGVNDTGPHNGPLVAVDEATCSVDFSVTPELEVGTGGSWDGISYAVDANGEGLVLFGTADPDSAAYAIDAITGATVWRFATDNPAPYSFDVGAGITVSPPGVDGWADGVAYVINKAGWLAALDLTTGAVYWTKQFGGSLATPSLDGAHLVFGNGTSMTSIDVQNGPAAGSVEWSVPAGPAVDGSPVIVGPSGAQVVAFGDLGGTVRVLSMATGASMYTYQTGNFITSSMAEVDGNLIEQSGDGYLYDFAPGGGNPPAPTTTVTSPADSSTVTNPGGHLTLAGTAGSSGGPAIGSVTVAVQEGGSAGPWWDGATGKWTAAPYPNRATITSPASSSTTWSLNLPIPPSGGTFEALASAVTTAGIADISAAQSSPTSARSGFTVSPSASAPSLTGSAYWIGPGSKVSFSGTRFSAGETVDINLGSASLVSATASSTGTFGPISATVPLSASFGPASFQATGQTSGLMATAATYVTNAWSQVGFGPLHQSNEADDPTFANHLSVSGDSYLNQAWSFTANSTLAISPAVARGVAYLADGSGTVTSVGVATGRQHWHEVVGGGSPITSSPALDTSAGLLFVGSTSGSVVALKLSTGGTAWTAPLGSSPVKSAPAVSGGVVYVGTDAGTVYALRETTGAVIWRASLAGAVTSSPAVDAAAKIVVAADSTGHVDAFSLTTGATLWSFATGGAVVSNPLVYSGGVYLGSTSGHFYDLKETTGVQVWSFQTSGPIDASPSLQSSNLFIGDTNGQEYELAAATGKATVLTKFASAIVGITTATEFIVTATANGLVQGTKGPGMGGWSTQLGSPSAGAAVILNGEIFVTSHNGLFQCYTIPGFSPV